MSTRQQERHIRYRQLRSVRMRCCLRWSFRKVPRRGAYRLVGVTYQINGTEQTLLFQDAGMDMRFGVNTTVENNPDSVVVEEPSANVDVVTMDENGNTESAESIGDAIQNAQLETPQPTAVMRLQQWVQEKYCSSIRSGT